MLVWDSQSVDYFEKLSLVLFIILIEILFVFNELRIRDTDNWFQNKSMSQKSIKRKIENIDKNVFIILENIEMLINCLILFVSNIYFLIRS